MATRSGKQGKPRSKYVNLDVLHPLELSYALEAACRNVFNREPDSTKTYIQQMNKLVGDEKFDIKPWGVMTIEEWKLIKLCADAGPNAYTMWRAYHAKNTKSPK